jgi:hypothetical protein
MDKPPPILHGAMVLAYATLDDSVVRVRKDLLYIDGKPLDHVAKLAISRSPGDKEVLLFFCDDDWELLGLSAHPSVDQAKRRTEREFRGVAAKWKTYQHKDVAAVERECLAPFCSFCGRPDREVERMFEGKNAFICGDCVRDLGEFLA